MTLPTAASGSLPVTPWSRRYAARSTTSRAICTSTPGTLRTLLVEVRIQAKSMDTGSVARDEHLRSNDFLDMERYPEIIFKSTGVERLDEDNYRVTGDLTIKGTTKPVTMDVQFTGVATDPDGDVRVGFEGTTKINRKGWGVNWNAALETGGVLVSEDVTIELDVSAVKVVA